MLSGCGSQLRVGGLGTPFGLDYGAVMLVAQARSVDLVLVAELLPITERAILSGGPGTGDDEEGDG